MTKKQFSFWINVYILLGFTGLILIPIIKIYMFGYNSGQEDMKQRVCIEFYSKTMPSNVSAGCMKYFK